MLSRHGRTEAFGSCQIYDEVDLNHAGYGPPDRVASDPTALQELSLGCVTDWQQGTRGLFLVGRDFYGDGTQPLTLSTKSKSWFNCKLAL